MACVDLVGEEDAERLQALNEQRAEIINNDFLGENEKKTGIAGLREQSFEQNQWRRVKAIERIHDSEASN